MSYPRSFSCSILNLHLCRFSIVEECHWLNAKNNDRKSFIETSKKYFDEIQKVCKKLKDTHSKSCGIKNLVCINDSSGFYWS